MVEPVPRRRNHHRLSGRNRRENGAAPDGLGARNDEGQRFKSRARKIAQIDLHLSVVAFIFVVAFNMVTTIGATPVEKDVNDVSVRSIICFIHIIFYMINVWIANLFLTSTEQSESTQDALSNAELWCVYKMFLFFIDVVFWLTEGGMNTLILCAIWNIYNLFSIWSVLKLVSELTN